MLDRINDPAKIARLCNVDTGSAYTAADIEKGLIESLAIMKAEYQRPRGFTHYVSPAEFDGYVRAGIIDKQGGFIRHQPTPIAHIEEYAAFEDAQKTGRSE